MAKNSFILYYNHREIFNELSDEEAGRLIKAIFDYEVDGNVSDDRFIKMVMIPIKQVLDNNRDKYELITERNKENGKKGGRPKKEENPKNPVGYLETQRNPKNLDIDIDIDIVNDNIDSNNIKYSVEHKDSIKSKYSDNNIYCLADARPCNDIPYQDIVDYLNSKIGSHYKASSNKTRTLIHARFKEGFNADDFKTVIDKKTAEWLKDTKMQKFLRPETLFGTKFEGYLNQKEKEVTTGDIAKTMNWEELF